MLPDPPCCPRAKATSPLRLGLPGGREGAGRGGPKPERSSPSCPEDNPLLKELPPEYQKKVLGSLPPDLPLAITANLIDDESYWQRCCVKRWRVCRVSRHGGSWKHMFFERHLANLLAHFIPGTSDPAVVTDLLPLCRDYVRRLRVDQFLPPVQLPRHSRDPEQSDSGSEVDMEESITDHYCLGPLVAGLGHLEELDLVFGVKDCGMNFEWKLFLFTYRDCHSLAATVKACHTLKVPPRHRLFRLPDSPLLSPSSSHLVRPTPSPHSPSPPPPPSCTLSGAEGLGRERPRRRPAGSGSGLVLTRRPGPVLGAEDVARRELGPLVPSRVH